MMLGLEFPDIDPERFAVWSLDKNETPGEMYPRTRPNIRPPSSAWDSPGPCILECESTLHLDGWSLTLYRRADPGSKHCPEHPKWYTTLGIEGFSQTSLGGALLNVMGDG